MTSFFVIPHLLQVRPIEKTEKKSFKIERSTKISDKKGIKYGSREDGKPRLEFRSFP